MRWLPLLLLAACASPERLPGDLVPLGKNLQGAEEYLRPRDGMVIVRVPAGEFTMGSDEHDPDERPRRTSKTAEFFIDKFEVTNAQFARFLTATGTDRDADGRPLVDMSVPGLARSGNTWDAAPGRERDPVTAATGWGALAYAKWVGGRLPTHEEWEKAARGTDGRTYPWGEDPPDLLRGNFLPSGFGTVQPVGSFPRGASPYGCMDMAGNVYERVAPADGPVGPLRSCAFFCPGAFQMRASDRCAYPLDRAHPGVGFRCAMDVPPGLDARN